MKQPKIDLKSPLPYPSRWRWGYQHYPVYSWAWWRGRSLIFGLGILIMASMSGLGAMVTFDNKTAAALTSLVFFVGVFGMAVTGATLCTCARNFVHSMQTQRAFVTVGLILGCVAAVMLDAWSSGYIENAFIEHSQESESLEALADAERRSNSAMVVDAIFGMLLYFFLAGGIAYIRYWREPGQLKTYLAEKELSEVRASRLDVQSRLSMLQAQIEPHFLFNSLASIKSTVRSSPELAENSIDDLVDYLRASIPRLDDQQNAQATTLQQQVALCEKYLKVMQLRMGDRLKYSTFTDPKIADAAFPPMLIISLVENAIKHGVEPKIDGGEINISAKAEGQDLVITVEDSGMGLVQSRHSELSSGVGLANVREQLNVLYGEKGSLQLESNQQGGATASVRIHHFARP